MVLGIKIHTFGVPMLLVDLKLTIAVLDLKKALRTSACRISVISYKTIHTLCCRVSVTSYKKYTPYAAGYL
jgi:hypothetical protein